MVILTSSLNFGRKNWTTLSYKENFVCAVSLLRFWITPSCSPDGARTTPTRNTLASYVKGCSPHSTRRLDHIKTLRLHVYYRYLCVIILCLRDWGSTLVHFSMRSLSATLPCFKWRRYHCQCTITLCSEFSQPCGLFRGANPLDASFHKTLPPCEFPCSWFTRRCQELNVFHHTLVWVFAF